ncbi:PH domain-containing protein [Micropruina sonneratiae]|uniref:PH domain-containing protein n=1 Tax=Micropruina sonneratiae TaxID=2986940 RepID=UPI002226B036|nr:PH domain-containing protein [Micropruina sp. KQZ13P-5]MCW3158810.1 PH domain-containing protein [Micropruina sp. KQZ13P-5]
MSVPPVRFSGLPGAPAPPEQGLRTEPESGPSVTPTPPAGATPPPPAVTVAAPLVEKPHPLTPLVRAWVLVVAALWAVGRELLNGTEGLRLPPLNWASGLFGALLLVLVVVAYLDWRATSFIVDAGELRIETGVFTRTSQRIRFDRIQAVDVTEPFAARLLGLAEITIDVGAEGGHKLRYLSRARAAAVRDYLLARAHGVRSAEVNQTVTTGVLDDLGEHDEVLVRVPPQRLLLGAVLSHEFLLLTVPLALFMVGMLVIGPPGETVRESPLIMLGAVLPALGVLWGFVSKRVIGQWNYAFVRSGHGLKITRGLASLTSQSVPRHRIQSLRIAQPIWLRRLGLYRLDMAVLGHRGLTTDEDQAGASSILLPIGTRAEVDVILGTVWPGLRLADIDLQHSPDAARWLQPFSHGWVGWGWDESVITTRQGWLTRVQLVVPHGRVQSLALEQGPLRRRLGLAAVSVHTTEVLAQCVAANLDAGTARELLFAEKDRARTSGLGHLLTPAPEAATGPTTGPMSAG